MKHSLVSVILMPQLKDNYSYLIKENKTNKVIIIDPAESKDIIEYIKKNDLLLKAILLTHHHNDHTAGVEKILKHLNVPVYSPSKNIFGTSKIINNNDKINLDFITLRVITTPGHTLDHVIFYDDKNKILFSGDTLFRLGCGRIFEGSFKTMHESLKKIEKLDNNIMVYCGHEYTLNNLKFLQSIFPKYYELNKIKANIDLQLENNKASIPFKLGEEKIINPFLSSKSSFYEQFKRVKNFNDFEMFAYLRKLKDNF